MTSIRKKEPKTCKKNHNWHVLFHGYDRELEQGFGFSHWVSVRPLKAIFICEKCGITKTVEVLDEDGKRLHEVKEGS